MIASVPDQPLADVIVGGLLFLAAIAAVCIVALWLDAHR